MTAALKKIIVLFIFCCAFPVLGQQDPFLSGDNLELGPIWHNPATYGTVNRFSVNAIGQLVWPDLPGHPSSFFINCEYRFGYTKNRREDTRALKSGIGINGLFDQGSFSTSTRLKLDYNLQVKVGTGRLSFGVSPGIQQMVLDTAWIPPTNVPDPNIPGNTTQSKFTLGAGLLYYWQKGYVGISATHLTGAFFEKVNYSEARHYFINAGYQWPLTKNLTFLPTAAFATDGAVSTFSTLLTFLTKPYVLVGAGYGIRNEVKATIGYAPKHFIFQYVVGFQYSNPLPGNNLVHELRLSYRKTETPGCSTCPHW